MRKEKKRRNKKRRRNKKEKESVLLNTYNSANAWTSCSQMTNCHLLSFQRTFSSQISFHVISYVFIRKSMKSIFRIFRSKVKRKSISCSGSRNSVMESSVEDNIWWRINECAANVVDICGLFACLAFYLVCRLLRMILLFKCIDDEYHELICVVRLFN